MSEQDRKAMKVLIFVTCILTMVLVGSVLLK